MPKERRDRSVSFDRSRVSPFPCSSSRSRQPLPRNPLESEENLKEWEEAQCPVCMEHPHNAILLLCSSHDKGCRPYMCDTSYRHSNCFDQFRKSFSEADSLIPNQEESAVPTVHTPAQTMITEATFIDLEGERSEEGSTSMPCENQEKPKLLCPLCRGQINGWIVVEPARLFMNAKSRSCASETCNFTGTYTDLRKHARSVHPLVRPSEADPERQRDWRRLERQRDLGDLFSTLQSSIGEERTDDSTLFFNDGSLLTIYFLVRVIRHPVIGGSSRSSSWSGTSRARAQMTARRRPATRHWGESYDGESRDDNNESSDGGSAPRVVFERNRRRPTSDDDEL